MVALLLQIVNVTLLTGAVGWMVWLWPVAPWLAVCALPVWLGTPALVLAAEMLVAGWIGRSDPLPVPSCATRMRAWAREVLESALAFGWRQPFSPDQIPDRLTEADGSQRLGVVLLAGFACNRGFWLPWLARLRSDGRVFLAVNLEPPFGSIEDYVPQVDAAVARVTAATGRAPVLVCHSMGGLAARAWLRQEGSLRRAYHVVTIGTPHRGTWLARFGIVTNGRQMQLGSPWLTELERGEHASTAAIFTCWYSDCDNVVFPPSVATLPGAQNRLVHGVGHVSLALCSEVMETTLAAIKREQFEIHSPPQSS